MAANMAAYKSQDIHIKQVFDNPSSCGKVDILLISLLRFYSNNRNIERMIPFLNHGNQSDERHSISLRLIDWFVTNYAKTNRILVKRASSDSASGFMNVYTDYRAQLKAYSKQQFDPFRRRDRIYLYYDKDKWIETTVGQLNFFRWMIQNDIIDYIVQHFADIERDMISNHKGTGSDLPAFATGAAGAGGGRHSRDDAKSVATRTSSGRKSCVLSSISRMQEQRMVSFE